MSKKLFLMIGAGASYDCIDSSITSARSEFRPPLVQEIFSHRAPFNNIMSKYKRVEAMADEIRTRLGRGNISIETLLKEYRDETELELKKQYWEIPYYLQELFGEISNFYIERGSTKFHTMLRALQKSSYEKILIASPNYDLFTEYAMRDVLSYNFNSFSAYIPDDKKISLIKLHGSVMWGKRILNHIEVNASTDFSIGTLREELNVDNKFHLLNGYQDVHQNNKLCYYPALSIPVEGKTDFNCPPEQIKYFKDFIVDCTDFLFIGFSAKDQHIVDVFQSVKEVTKVRIVSGSQKGAIDTMNKLHSVNNAFPLIENPNQYNLIYDIGYTLFMKNFIFDSFLQSKV